MGADERAAALERLAAARAGFAERLPGRIAALADALAAARDHGDLAEAITLAHRLAGTAGSFGRDDVGEAAAALEAELKMADGGAPDWTAIDAGLQALHATSA